MTDFTIRKARESDLDEIMRIENACFGTDAWSVQNMRDELVGQQRFYVVANAKSSADQLIAYAGLAISSATSQADIQTIAVSEDARGQGLGRALMNSLLAEARSKSLTEVFLEVRADNQTAELAVGIRTFWLEGGRLNFGTGAGITWASDPEAEWAETELKASRLLTVASGTWKGSDS